MQAISYQFGERAAMSEGVADSHDVQDVIMQTLAGARNVIRAHGDNDRTGTDYWVEMSYGGWRSVDVKARDEDWSVKGEKFDDLALETWSVKEQSKIGWTRNDRKRTDYILWFWRDTRRFCLVPFAPLCHVFSRMWPEWSKQYKLSEQHTPGYSGGYHSECVFVPRKVVWRAIYTELNGHLESQDIPL